MDHLSLVVSQSAINKMSSQNLSIIFAPLLMIKSESEGKEIDFNQPINILRYLLDVWPSKSGMRIENFSESNIMEVLALKFKQCS